MGNYFKRIMQGLAVVGVLTTRLPLIVMDGKVTIDELAALAQEICIAGGWKLSLSIPDDLAGKVIGVMGDMD